ncbi:MAG: 30S ribosomal protein S1 [Thermodesulfobacteriota bacterium]
MTQNGKNTENIPEDELDEESLAASREFMQMYEDSLKAIQSGHIVEGEIVDIERDNVLIDIGYKSEGLVSKSEFTDLSGNLTVSIGDRVEVFLIRKEEDGYPVLSREEAEKDKRLDQLKAVFENEDTVEGTIISRIKGGFIVDIGLKAFLPGSQLDDKPVKNPEAWLNQTYEFKIVQFNKADRNVVLSRRALIEAQRREMAQQTMARLEVGDTVEGEVKNITDYGLFVDIGGINGLVHISNISWGPVRHPSEKHSVGDRLHVKVLDIDAENKKISLGIKQLFPDPWENIEAKYPVGTTVSGRVISLKNYGAFVSIEEGIVGLIGTSDLSWTQKIRHPNQMLQIDDTVECMVLNINASKRQMALGLKQLAPNPWEKIAETYPVGSIIEGNVKQVTDFGIFVGITDEIDGLVHVSDLPANQKNPADHYQKGQSVQAKITEIDRENQRVKLSIRQLAPDPWQQLPHTYPPGTDIAGKVANITDFGIFVDIGDGIQGLVHVSEIPAAKGEDVLEQFTAGQEVEARIIEVLPAEKKIRLTMKPEKETPRPAEKTQSGTASDFGSLLKEKMKGQQDETDE